MDEAKPLAPRRGVVALVPFVGDLLAMLRLLGDREASNWRKLLVVATVAYVIFPLDLIPDAVPVIGWLDDVGVVIAVRIALSRELARYRYPLFARRAPAPTVAA